MVMLMKKYIGVKQVEAEPMTRGVYNQFRGWTIPVDENVNDEGYKIEYPDGYISWCPKEIFDGSHLALTDPEGTKICQEDVDNFLLVGKECKFGDKTTVMHYTLRNGYEMVEASSCVDPVNYNADIGMNICNDKAKSKVWEYLGFLLQCAKGGMG